MKLQTYNELISRNIGIISEAQQEALKNTTIAVFGLGGLGGVICEIFTRSGVGSLKITDHDKFDPTNLNRQIFSFTDTLGRLKTDVTEEFLKKINPDVKIEKFTEVTQANINQILKNVSVAVLAIDSAKPCLIISRAAKKLAVPLVEGWAIPFANARVLTKDSPSLEEAYGLPSAGRDIESLSEEDYKNLKLAMLAALRKIQGVAEFYPPDAVDKIIKGQIPSFAPLVWLTAVTMSLEALKVLLKWGKASVSPSFTLFNPFDISIPKQEA